MCDRVSAHLRELAVTLRGGVGGKEEAEGNARGWEGIRQPVGESGRQAGQQGGLDPTRDLGSWRVLSL